MQVKKCFRLKSLIFLLESNPSKSRRLSLFFQAFIRNGLIAADDPGNGIPLVAFENQMIGPLKLSGAAFV